MIWLFRFVYRIITKNPGRPKSVAKWALITALVLQGLGTTALIFKKTSHLQVASSLDLLMKEWNYVSGPIVEKYKDPTVNAEAWLISSENIIVELTSIYFRMVQLIEEKEDRDPVFIKLVENKRKKINALVNLRSAVASGNINEEKMALKELTTLGDESMEIYYQQLLKYRGK